MKKGTAAGFEMKNLSVASKGYHTDEKVVGFYNAGDRIKFTRLTSILGLHSGAGQRSGFSLGNEWLPGGRF